MMVTGSVVVLATVLALGVAPVGSSVEQKGVRHYRMVIPAAPTAARQSGGEFAETDSVLACYPQALPDWTGNVRFENSTYYKYSGDLYFRGGNAASHDRRQAWVKFDLTQVPDNATITAAYVGYYCYAVGEMPTTALRLVVSDPVNASAYVLYNEICSGTQIGPDYAHGEGWQFRQLNSSGVSAVQSRLVDNWIAVGVHNGSNNRNAWGYAYGFSGGPGGQYRPYLSLDFSVPAAVDVSMQDIVTPSGTITPGSTVYPSGIWRNRQTQPATFAAYFFLYDRMGTMQYGQAVTVTGLAGGRDTLVVFPVSGPLNDTGLWSAHCSTYAVGDVERANDIRTESFRVGAGGSGQPGDAQVAVTGIVEPARWVDTNSVVAPTAIWRNYGGQPAAFSAYFALVDPAGVRVYDEMQAVPSLAPARDTVLVFPSYNFGTNTGTWVARCSTSALYDTIPADDILQMEFTVYAGTPPWVPGWHEVSPMPALPSQKPVKDGGWLTIDRNSGLLYAAKGNKVGDFYRYDPGADTWKTLALWPEGWEKKPPKKGSNGIADGRGHVYATKGANTLAFWRYDIGGDSWHQSPDVPIGEGKKVKGGNDFAYVEMNGVGYVYLLKGCKNEFLRFNVSTDTWERQPSAPVGRNGKWDNGSWLAYDGDRYIYAHKAKIHELWRFDLVAGDWDTTLLPGMPMMSRNGKNKKSKDGGCGAWDNGSLGALKGGNTNEFYRFVAGPDTWAELETIPSFGSTAKKRRVKMGGDIVRYQDRFFFALKGSKTRELWYYYEPPQGTDGLQSRGPVVRTAAAAGIALYPNPLSGRRLIFSCGPDLRGPFSVAFFDAAGRLARRATVSESGGLLDLVGLKSGVYLVRVEAPGLSVSDKLVAR